MSNDGWGKMPGTLVLTTPAPTTKPVGDGWAKTHYNDWVKPCTPPKKTHEQINAEWALSSLPGANNRAAVLNSINGKQDQYTIDPDGELSNVKWIKPAADEPTGVYIMYSNGQWLNTVLSGPYASEDDANNWVDVAFELMTKDEVFKLAFDNQFDRSQVYLASIPLAAKRHGAYGVLS